MIPVPYVIVLAPPIASTGIPPNVSPTVVTLTVKSTVPFPSVALSKSWNVISSPTACPWPGSSISTLEIALLDITTFNFNPVPEPVELS